ncbi:MerR family transcriptional regulator [Rubellimicrobium rubrum]|uniref:MerR family transcriptional regulator n=1 Tax=Rubellimicrobium rubrum TaxID=2585369 RepID=A0A5C4N448_9RHOB|nr:MerR family transcriptional regulator [Rubellimicrobium rubrum]
MATGARPLGKSPDAFRTISEVAAFLETPAHVLRFWESKFPQIKPVKRAGGRRYYRPDDIALLGGIKVLLHEQGMTIKGVQKLLRERGPRYVAGLSTLPWEGDAAEEVVEAAMPEEAVIVGPWPGARAEDEPAPVQPARLTILEEFVVGTMARMSAPTPEASTPLQPSAPLEPAARPDAAMPPAPRPESRVTHLREVLARVDAERLRMQAPRLAPLVARLREVRQGMSAAR